MSCILIPLYHTAISYKVVTICLWYQMHLPIYPYRTHENYWNNQKATCNKAIMKSFITLQIYKVLLKLTSVLFPKVYQQEHLQHLSSFAPFHRWQLNVALCLQLALQMKLPLAAPVTWQNWNLIIICLCSHITVYKLYFSE